MRVKKTTFRYCVFLASIACLVIVLFISCDLFGDDSKTQETQVQFTNLEYFPVTVYSDASRQTIFAEVGAQSSFAVKTTPNQAGVAFYFTYRIVLEGIQIPYNPQPVIVRIDENKTNTVTILQLTSLSSASAYIKIWNKSSDSLTLKSGESEMLPIGAVSTILSAGEDGAYQISPGPVASYSIMRNTIYPVSLPESLTSFEANYIYSLEFNGATLTLNRIPVDIDLARMQLVMGTGKTLAEMLKWLNDNAEDGVVYTLYILADEAIDPAYLYYGGKNVTIILKTIEQEGEKTISLKSNGSLFGITRNVHLVLEDGIILRGTSPNNNSLITVAEGIFTMNGGIITGNTSSRGAGVNSWGTFIMKGGEISGNSSTSTASGNGGGGVATTGTFTMSGGVIYGNTAAVGLRNTTAHGIGAALLVEGTAQYGTFNGDVFNRSGDLNTTSTTIRIVNGSLQTN